MTCRPSPAGGRARISPGAKSCIWAGDTQAARDADRHALWSAFRESGAATTPPPPPQDGAAATSPAAAHLGRAACTLALLPIEDALSLPEQPNLPGTTDEHPNWRRRLPGDAADTLRP